MPDSVVRLILSLAAQHASDSEIIAAVRERLELQLSLADVETVLISNEWYEVAA